MPPELEYIEFVFENSDSIRIPASSVLGVSFEKISNYLWVNFSHQLIEENVCEKFEIDLDNTALSYQTYLKDNFINHLDDIRDITHVNLKPKSREGIYIAVPWKSGKQENENIYQKTIFQDDSFIISCEKNNNEQ